MYGIKLKVWGDYACFTRPEFSVERVSYDCMTPSAARGILDSIHWKPAIKWVIDEISILKPIKLSNIRRNEVSTKMSPPSKKVMNGEETIPLYISSQEKIQQRATVMLKDVAYIISAHFIMTDKAGEEDNPEKHYNIFLRRARKGQFYNPPYLGCREFGARFSLVEEDESYTTIDETRDLGYMLYDIDFKDNNKAMFFKADMEKGVIKIPPKREVLK